MAGMGNVLAMMAQAPEPTKWKSPQEMALEQAQTAHAQASAQQAKAAALNLQQESAKMEREAAQQRANQEAWKRAAVEAGGDPEKFLSMAQQYGVSQKEWADTRKALDDHAETVLKGTKEQQAMALTRNARQRALIEGVMSQADPVAKKRALAEANRMAVAEGLDPIPNDEESLPLLHGLLGVEGSIAKEATAKAEEARKQAAELRAQQDADRKQQEFDVEQPVKAALAKAQLENPDLLTPQQAQQAQQFAQQQAMRDQEFKLSLDKALEDARHNKASEHYQSMSVEGVQLTEDAKNKMAEMFATTGQLPSLGMGKQASAMRSEIINRASKNFGNVDFATSKATFQANQNSLKNLQKLSDQVDAFENTAGKNIDMFLKTARDVVDTGSPLLNKPARAAAQLMGSDKMAAFNAARETALTEAAKVLESPTGGSSLSIAGREAVKTLSAADATLGQQVAAMKLLKQDMANRKQANQEQIKAIRDRITPGESPAPVKWTKDANGNPVRAK